MTLSQDKKTDQKNDQACEMTVASKKEDTRKSFFLARWWKNYLKRLNKVTDGKPQCCDHH